VWCRTFRVAVVVLALAGCGGDDDDEPVIQRRPLVEQIMDGIRGTVGFADDARCVEGFLDTRSTEELQQLANGGNRDLDREFTDAVVACVDA
jgi:hypothetical protein